MRPPHGFHGVFRNDEVARAVYAEAAGIARVMPRAVAIPADADDAAALVRWAHAAAVPLVPRGSGSSMAGGAIGDGIVVDLSRLDVIGPVDVARRRVTTGPGAVRAAVSAAAGRDHLWFPVDPSSGAYCTIGGMASTNAAGPHSLRYGSMRSWVTALDCVFDDGSRAVVERGAAPPAGIPAISRFREDAHEAISAARDGAAARLPGVIKDSSGYRLAEYADSGDLVDCLVGSEGTLALFVGVELALAALPAATSSLLAAFPTLDGAVRGAVTARAAGASACELLDRTFLDVAGSGGLLPDTVDGATEAVLLSEVEGSNADEAAAAAESLADTFRGAGATAVAVALEPRAEQRLWDLRHAASPILSRLDPSLKSMQFVEDGAVPPERLAEYIRGVRAILKTHAIRGVIFGHAGDAHVHVNPLVDVRRRDWRQRVSAILEEVAALTADLGGTMTGEHGDGRLRTPLLARTHPCPETLELYTRVKRAFDPVGILNPGVKVPLPGQVPLGDIKYDPNLPPVPARAAAVLERVTAERGYATLRLALLDALDAV